MASGANILILYNGVDFSFSVGNLRPITSNSFNYKKDFISFQNNFFHTSILFSVFQFFIIFVN